MMDGESKRWAHVSERFRFADPIACGNLCLYLFLSHNKALNAGNCHSINIFKTHRKQWAERWLETWLTPSSLALLSIELFYKQNDISLNCKFNRRLRPAVLCMSIGPVPCTLGVFALAKDVLFLPVLKKKKPSLCLWYLHFHTITFNAQRPLQGWIVDSDSVNRLDANERMSSGSEFIAVHCLKRIKVGARQFLRRTVYSS